MLRLVLEKDDWGSLEAPIQTLYKLNETDSKYYLDVDNPYKTQVAEFRDNNIKLTKQMATLQVEAEKFKDIDPTKAKEALDKLQLIQDKKLIEEGKIEELVTARTDRMKQDYANQISALTTSKEDILKTTQSIKDRLAKVTIDNAIQLAVSTDSVPVKGALADIISRGRGVFSLNEKGEVVALDDKGGVRYGKDGNLPLSIQEWAASLPTEAPFLFEASAGAGSRGGEIGGGGAGSKFITPDQIADNLEGVANGTIKVQLPG